MLSAMINNSGVHHFLRTCLKVYTGFSKPQWIAYTCVNSATRNKTAEAMKAEMEEISRRLDQSEDLETNLQKSTAKDLLASVGNKAVNFEDVADVG